MAAYRVRLRCSWGSRTGRAPRAPPASLGVAANRWLPHPTTRTGRGCSTLPALPRGSWPEQLRLCLRLIARLWARWAPVVIAGGPRVARCLHGPGFLTRSLTETWRDRTGRLGARESSRLHRRERPRADGTRRHAGDVALCAHNPEIATRRRLCRIGLLSGQWLSARPGWAAITFEGLGRDRALAGCSGLRTSWPTSASMRRGNLGLSPPELSDRSSVR